MATKKTAAKTKAAPAKKATKTAKVARYTVQRGDTLYSIARQFKVAADDLARWNGITPGTLKAGITLNIQLAQNP